MLTNSFLHIPGIGSVTEKRLWTSGLLDWHQVDSAEGCDVPAKNLMRVAACMAESCEHLDKNNPAYFADHLPAGEHWRFFPQFRKTTAFMDIETTGMDVFGSEITTIALYDGESIKYYVQGQNLDAFMEDIGRYNVIVTYNGKTFDVPFIEKYFGIEMTHAHIDLRYVLKSLGYGGGLKRCEKLYQQKDPVVRQELAENDETPRFILKKMVLHDSEKSVSKAAEETLALIEEYDDDDIEI